MRGARETRRRLTAPLGGVGSARGEASLDRPHPPEPPMTGKLRLPAVLAVVLAARAAPAALLGQQPAITLEQLMSPPFPDELVAAPTAGVLAWVFDARGARNIWVATPPDYRGRQVTAYAEDDGQEIAGVEWTPDAKTIVYVRGGGANRRGEYPNPTSVAAGVEQAVWASAVTGGAPPGVGGGHAPAVLPQGGRVALLPDGPDRLGRPG